jgi:hypothetical protein
MYRATPPDRRIEVMALALISGGAIGNLIDRIRAGQVVDFIDVGIGATRFWTFNIADAGITVGAVLLALTSLLPPTPDPAVPNRRPRRPPVTSATRQDRQRVLRAPDVIGAARGGLDRVGRGALLAGAILATLPRPRRYFHASLAQAYHMGIRSLPLVLFMAAVGGALASQQTGAQFTGGLPVWVTGASWRRAS